MWRREQILNNLEQFNVTTINDMFWRKLKRHILSKGSEILLHIKPDSHNIQFKRITNPCQE